MRFFLEGGFDITGFDPKEGTIAALKNEYPNHAKRITVNSIETYNDSVGFDYIICNAVLHFAEDHDHFTRMIHGIARLMKPGGDSSLE